MGPIGPTCRMRKSWRKTGWRRWPRALRGNKNISVLLLDWCLLPPKKYFLFRYKREMANCLTAARNLRLEEARMDKEACEKEEQAERLERQARALDEEAAKLEKEARQNGQGGWWRWKKKQYLRSCLRWLLATLAGYKCIQYIELHSHYNPIRHRMLLLAKVCR